MSYVEVFKVEADGDVVSFDSEARNNHVFAPLVWSILCEKYGYSQGHGRYDDPGVAAMWKEWPSPKMTRAEQVLLGATFDRVWVKKDLIPELIEACQEFYNTYFTSPQPCKNWMGQTEFRSYDDRAIVGVIVALIGISEDSTARGAAFNCCSAVTPFWYVSDVPPSSSKDGGAVHAKDSDCAEYLVRMQDDSTGATCSTCEAQHEDPCPECSATAFHLNFCSDYQWESRPWNVDTDKVQPRGEYRGSAAWELSERLSRSEVSPP